MVSVVVQLKMENHVKEKLKMVLSIAGNINKKNTTLKKLKKPLLMSGFFFV